MADNINSTNPSDIATRAQVEREIADWLRFQKLWTPSEGFFSPQDMARSIHRGEYRKDKA